MAIQVPVAWPGCAATVTASAAGAPSAASVTLTLPHCAAESQKPHTTGDLGAWCSTMWEPYECAKRKVEAADVSAGSSKRIREERIAESVDTRSMVYDFSNEFFRCATHDGDALTAAWREAQAQQGGAGDVVPIITDVSSEASVAAASSTVDALLEEKKLDLAAIVNKRWRQCKRGDPVRWRQRGKL